MKYEADSSNAYEGKLYVYDSVDLYQLEQVAYQNPVKGGDAVFSARMMLWIEVLDDRWSNGERRNNPVIQEEERFAFKLYPNPSNGQLTLEYTLKEGESGTFGIYSTGGLAVKRYPIRWENSVLRINESDLASGTYIYAIKINGELRKMDKLVIVK